jgi:hypothetical protein
VYPNPRVAQEISGRFLPVKVHIKEQPDTFKRFNAPWTPTLLLLDADGVERHRIEGFLPADDLLAQLDLGLGKIAFQRSEYGEAEKRFRSVVRSYGASGAAPEACYWAGVSAYKASKDPQHLAATAKALKEKYPDSEWTRKSSVWA